MLDGAMFRWFLPLSVALVLVSPAKAGAQASDPGLRRDDNLRRDDRQTVCTITVNSPDERDVFQRYLPADRYRFVELVEHGRRDWLASACQAKVRCDILVVSGHFAGSEFYSSRPTVNETLKVSEIERAQCTESCPDVFANLKEVYLFGCDTLKPEPVRYGESSRDLMRGLFAHVPVIYGFSSLAPLGRVSGPMLEGYFRSAPEVAVGSGVPSARLLSLFAPSSMVSTTGESDDEPHAAYRRETCRYYDERIALAERIDAVHAVLAGDSAKLRMSFDRVEAFFGSIDPAPATVASDAEGKQRYLSLTRGTPDPAIRLRMIALARRVGWLDGDSERGEKALLARDVVADAAMGFGEVELVCSLNADASLDGAADGLPPQRTVTVAQSAGRACLGSAPARSRVLKALASAREEDVQVAQAYLRQRPIREAAELRAMALDVSRMKSVPAQVRALDTLGRHHIADRDVIVELSRLFEHTHSLDVQRAIAEIFLRTGPGALDSQVVATLRAHRLRAPGAQPDLIDQLLRRLSS